MKSPACVPHSQKHTHIMHHEENGIRLQTCQTARPTALLGRMHIVRLLFLEAAATIPSFRPMRHAADDAIHFFNTFHSIQWLGCTKHQGTWLVCRPSTQAGKHKHQLPHGVPTTPGGGEAC